MANPTITIAAQAGEYAEFITAIREYHFDINTIVKGMPDIINSSNAKVNL